MAADRRIELAAAIRAGVEAGLIDLHTGMPGQVISFDPDEQTADIQLVVKTKQAGKLENRSVLKAVPVRYPSSKAFSITWPLVEGDEVWVQASERSIDVWLESGGIKDPADIRKHSFSDAFAFPMMYSQLSKITNFNPDDLEIKSRNGSAKVTVKEIGEVAILGDVIVTGDVVADGISLKNHTHSQANDSDGDVEQDTSAPL